MHLRTTGRRCVALITVLMVAACSGTPAATSAPSASNPVQATPTTSAAAPSDPTTGACSLPAVPGRPPAGTPPASLVPDRGAWFGMGLDWATDSVAAVRQRAGPELTPAVWVQFARVPLRPEDRTSLDGFVEQVRSVDGIALITLEPTDGLASVDQASAAAVADLLAGYRACGVGVILRFAHEMNGSWYAWGQDPTAYVASFRMVAATVHQRAPGVAMLWAPNSGSGYPFAGGAFAAKPGSAAATALDTNLDRKLTAADDPYAPYWPGDDAVDWVGMSAYHFGNTYPWGANVVPRPDAFAGLLTGSSGGPDFYSTWAVGHQKPMAIVETAALWRPSGGGASELAIKQGWWRQVFSEATRRDFGDVRLIGWFEWRKHEAEVNDIVDWRLTANPKVLAAFAADLPNGLLGFAPAS
jgi:hypothetical protein